LNKRTRSNLINQLADDLRNHYIVGMADNVVSLAEWKAKQPKAQAKRVPVYTPVRDPAGGYRLELVKWVEWDEAVPPRVRLIWRSE
jgi:hypothetical protein